MFLFGFSHAKSELLSVAIQHLNDPPYVVYADIYVWCTAYRCLQPMEYADIDSPCRLAVL